MIRIYEFVRKHAFKILTVPAAIGGIEFFYGLFEAAHDGIITNDELHHLVSIASPIQLIFLGVVMAALKKGS